MLCTFNARWKGFGELVNVFVRHVRVSFVYILFVGGNVHNICKVLKMSGMANIFALIWQHTKYGKTIKFGMIWNRNFTSLLSKNLNNWVHLWQLIFQSKKLGIFKCLFLGIVFSHKIKHSPVRRTTDEMLVKFMDFLPSGPGNESFH